MFDTAEFVADLRVALRETQPSLAVREVVERAISDPRGVERGLGAPSRADLAVLHAGADVTVLHAVWAPHMNFLPHDHNMTAVIGLYGGREDNTFWRRAEPGLEQAGGRVIDPGEVVVLGEKLIHSVANPDGRLTAAIHVYLGDYLHAARSEWDPETHEERQAGRGASR